VYIRVYCSMRQQSVYSCGEWEWCRHQVMCFMLVSSAVAAGNHSSILETVGYTDVRKYRYYLKETRGLDFEGMVEDIMVSSLYCLALQLKPEPLWSDMVNAVDVSFGVWGGGGMEFCLGPYLAVIFSGVLTL